MLIPKNDGSYQFCFDYHKLNQVTKKDVYPLPWIDDILDTLERATYFTTLDLASRYWQIGMDAESAAKSAFITHRGLHEFVRMPFGMCNAPATFQRLMEVILADLLWKCCFVYIDDVLIKFTELSRPPPAHGASSAMPEGCWPTSESPKMHVPARGSPVSRTCGVQGWNTTRSCED